jgi:hypothetical protein
VPDTLAGTGTGSGVGTGSGFGDRAALEQFVRGQLARRPTGPMADYLRWRAWHTIGPRSPFGRPALEPMQTDATLRWIGIEAQDTGVGLEDGRRAIDVRLWRPGTREERFERWLGAFSYAVNHGRQADARSALAAIADVQPEPTFHLRLTILAVLYAGGLDEDAAVEAARELAGRDAGTRTLLDSCVLAQWSLATDSARDPPAWGAADTVTRRACVLVYDAQRLAATGDPAAGEAIDRLDRFLQSELTTALVDSGHLEYAHLALARLHEARGDPAAALGALRRRGFYLGWQPSLAEMLHMEARLAARLGDREGAIRAYQHLRAFRDDPDPSIAEEMRRLQSELNGSQ